MSGLQRQSIPKVSVRRLRWDEDSWPICKIVRMRLIWEYICNEGVCGSLMLYMTGAPPGSKVCIVDKETDLVLSTKGLDSGGNLRVKFDVPGKASSVLSEHISNLLLEGRAEVMREEAYIRYTQWATDDEIRETWYLCH